MIQCKDCKFYRPDVNTHGWCRINLPVWFSCTVPMATNRYIRANDGCDLGKEAGK